MEEEEEEGEEEEISEGASCEGDIRISWEIKMDGE